VTFGPYAPLNKRYLLRFKPLVADEGGVVSGICHNGLDPGSPYISIFGATCDPRRLAENARIGDSRPFQARLNNPLGSRGHTWSWYMTKAPLRGLSEVQVCQDRDQLHRPCIGLLLYYEDGLVESLGQIRIDISKYPEYPNLQNAI
jgi:hypothetical protein